MEVAYNHSWGKEEGTSMRELGVVIAWVPAALRPQIQEAVSVPQLVAGRLLQGERRLPVGKESTAQTQHSCGSSCVGAQLTGTSETPTLPSRDSVNLGGPDSCRAVTAWVEEGGKGISRKMQGAPEPPDESKGH